VVLPLLVRPLLAVISHKVAVVEEEVVVASAPKLPDHLLDLPQAQLQLTKIHSWPMRTRKRELISPMELSREPKCQRETVISQRRVETAVVPVKEVEEVVVVDRVELVATLEPLQLVVKSLLLLSNEDED